MHIISRKALKDAGLLYGITSPLDSRYKIAKSATWKNLDEVRKTYPSADGVVAGENRYTVFKISGNKFRLIAGINYETQRIFIKRVLTHAVYSKGDWKNERR